MVSAAPRQAPPARRQESHHPPFSVRASWRETIAFVGGLVAIVGAFGPWLHLGGTSHSLFEQPAPFGQTIWGGLAGGPAIAILCAFALASSLVPLDSRVRLGVRLALFVLAALTVVGALAYAVFSADFQVFRDVESVRPGWGSVLAVVGTFAAAGATLSRLLERRRSAAASAAGA